jgi:hypothetical protein
MGIGAVILCVILAVGVAILFVAMGKWDGKICVNVFMAGNEKPVADRGRGKSYLPKGDMTDDYTYLNQKKSADADEGARNG